MFKLYYDYNGKEKNKKINSVSSDSAGYPKFLIHTENQWVWKSAKHFRPIEEEEV